MSYLFNVNVIGGADGGAEAMFAYKQQAKAAGWDVPSSSDGLTYNAGGDQISHSGAGAGGMNNSRAWYRLRAPAAMSPRREYCRQRGSGGQAAWWLKLSAEDGFTGGAPDATNMPTATDEQNLHGSTTAGTTLFATAGTYNINVCADNASPFGSYLFTSITGTGAQDMGDVFEPLVPGTFPIEDADPALYYVRQSTPFSIAQLAASGTGPFGWHAKNLGGEAFVRYPACVFCDSGGTRQFPNVGTNPNNGKDDTSPIPYVRGSGLATQIGVKGLAGTVMRWLGTTRANKDTLTVVSARDYIVMGNVALPWDGSVPIV
jgi:hypothetical protein